MKIVGLTPAEWAELRKLEEQYKRNGWYAWWVRDSSPRKSRESKS